MLKYSLMIYLNMTKEFLIIQLTFILKYALEYYMNIKNIIFRYFIIMS